MYFLGTIQSIYVNLKGCSRKKIDQFLRTFFSVRSLKGWVTAASVSKTTFPLCWLLSSDNFPNNARQLSQKLDASGLLDLCKTSARSRETVLCGIGTWSPSIDKCILGVHTDISSADYYSADLDISTCCRLNCPAPLMGGSSSSLSECFHRVLLEGIYTSIRFHLGFLPFPPCPATVTVLLHEEVYSSQETHGASSCF